MRQSVMAMMSSADPRDEEFMQDAGEDTQSWQDQEGAFGIMFMLSPGYVTPKLDEDSAVKEEPKSGSPAARHVPWSIFRTHRRGTRPHKGPPTSSSS